MPFDGSGNFNRVRNWVNDALALIKIRADLHDSEDDNFASGLSNTLTKDGQSQPVADIPMNGHKIINLGAPGVPGDAATKGYVDGLTGFGNGITLPAAAPNSVIRFTDADLGFGARKAANPVGSLNRWVWNDRPDMSGTDVAVMDETGKMVFGGAVFPASTRSTLTVPSDISMNTGAIRFNSYYDTVAATAKAVVAGFTANIAFDPVAGTVTINRSAASVAAGAASPGVGALSFNNSQLKFGNGSAGVQLQWLSTLCDSYKIAGSNRFGWFKSSDGTAAGSGVGLLMTLDDNGNLVIAGTSIVSGTTNIILGPTGAGTCYLRPNGVGSATGQFYVQSDGTAVANGSVVLTQANLSAYMANITCGALGSTALLRNDSGSVIGGGVGVAGGSLIYTSASGNQNGGPPAGTWRCMGIAGNGANPYDRVTTWLRYA